MIIDDSAGRTAYSVIYLPPGLPRISTTTYAGGASCLDDITLVESLSGGKLDLTIGSALDIFGGSGVRYEDAAKLGRRA